MADSNIRLPADSVGKMVDTELIGDVHRQRFMLGGASLAALAVVLNSAPVGTEYALITRNIPNGTQGISASSLPLPTGAATETTLSGIKGGTDKIPTQVSGRMPVDPSGVTSPVSVSSLPLPTGAASETTLAGIKTGTDKLPTLVGGRMPVDPSGVTSPVSLASQPLPTGAATEATLGTAGASPPSITGTGIIGWLRGIYEKVAATLTADITDRSGRLLGHVTVDTLPAPSGTQAISAASLPLPTGAATEASLGTSGSSPPTNPGTGMMGWLRGIYEVLSTTGITSTPDVSSVGYAGTLSPTGSTAVQISATSQTAKSITVQNDHDSVYDVLVGITGAGKQTIRLTKGQSTEIRLDNINKVYVLPFDSAATGTDILVRWFAR